MDRAPESQREKESEVVLNEPVRSWYQKTLTNLSRVVMVAILLSPAYLFVIRRTERGRPGLDERQALMREIIAQPCASFLRLGDRLFPENENRNDSTSDRLWALGKDLVGVPPVAEVSEQMRTLQKDIATVFDAWMDFHCNVAKFKKVSAIYEEFFANRAPGENK